MAAKTRAAAPEDIPAVIELLVAGGIARAGRDPLLWALAEDPAAESAAALRFALEGERQPFRQAWLVAEAAGWVCGVAHSMRLPVPPIYAGRFGQPGLILGDSCVSDAAPDGTARALMEAAEADLLEDGAGVLLAAGVPGDGWAGQGQGAAYRDLTLYYNKALGAEDVAAPDVRKAGEGDVAGIVAASAVNRRVLHQLDRFWEPHGEADARFGAWMTKSLGLADRDMLVAGAEGKVEGYAVAQPAGPLHLPPAHDPARTGFLDDYYHADFADPDRLADDGAGALALLNAAEAAFRSRGKLCALVVCPAAWTSKRALLQRAGYEVGLVWGIRWPQA